jgi:riboflavin biosynthesis pyrimidine reductase
MPSIGPSGTTVMRVEESRGTPILTEGGPTLFGQFVRERAVDELFLTVPLLRAGPRREDPLHVRRVDV